MSKAKFINGLIDVAAELGSFVEKAQKELDPDQYRVLESTAYKALASLERGMAQLVYLEDQYHRMRGLKKQSRVGQMGILYHFKPTKRRPSRNPGKKD